MLFLKRFFFSGLARPKHVQADPGHHGHEPTAEIFNAVDVGAREAEPGFLDGVVRFPIGTQNPIGDRPHLGTALLELLGQPIAFSHFDSPSMKFYAPKRADWQCALAMTP